MREAMGLKLKEGTYLIFDGSEPGMLNIVPRFSYKNYRYFKSLISDDRWKINDWNFYHKISKNKAFLLKLES